MPETTTISGTPAAKAVAEADFLPAGFEKDTPDLVPLADGRRVYRRIHPHVPGGEPVVFLLMQKENEDPADLSPFYIMQNKVSNRVFHQVLTSRPHDPNLDKVDRGGGADLPVFEVSVDLAHEFAAAEGRIADARQLDKAAGRFRKLEGPFKGARLMPVDPPATFPEGFALDRQPKPVHEAGPDESIFGCQNLASNGYEWTCGVYNPPDPQHGEREDTLVPFDDPDKKVKVSVRGVSYNDSRPFLYSTRLVGMKYFQPEPRPRLPDPESPPAERHQLPRRHPHPAEAGPAGGRRPTLTPGPVTGKKHRRRTRLPHFPRHASGGVSVGYGNDLPQGKFAQKPSHTHSFPPARNGALGSVARASPTVTRSRCVPPTTLATSKKMSGTRARFAFTMCEEPRAARSGEETPMSYRRASQSVRRIALAVLALGLVASPGRAQPPESEAGHKYALLIGISHYSSKGSIDLRCRSRYPERDVEELRDVLLACGYERDNVWVMTNRKGEKEPQFYPLADNISDKLELFLQNRSPQDSVLIAFAGHGVQFLNERECYLCPVDARLDDRKSLISLGAVYDRLQACKAGVKVVLVDACRNDPTLDPARSAKVLNLESVRFQPEEPPTGTAVLCSCSKGQVAFEDEELQHGVFFHFLIKGLGGEAADANRGEVTLNGLYGYLVAKVDSYARKHHNREQRPQPPEGGVERRGNPGPLRRRPSRPRAALPHRTRGHGHQRGLLPRRQAALSGSHDGTLRVWDLATGSTLTYFRVRRWAGCAAWLFPQTAGSPFPPGLTASSDCGTWTPRRKCASSRGTAGASTAWPFPPTGAPPSPAARTGRSASGTWTPASRGCGCGGTPGVSGASPSCPTAVRSSPAAPTRPCGCGTWQTARNGRSSGATRAPS